MNKDLIVKVIKSNIEFKANVEHIDCKILHTHNDDNETLILNCVINGHIKVLKITVKDETALSVAV